MSGPKAHIVGVGESNYTRWGKIGDVTEHALACQAIQRAVMGGRPMTLEDHQASPMIADPHRLFDCRLESDGACAVVVTTAERARDLAKAPVEILASEQGAPKGYAFGPFTNANIPDDLEIGMPVEVVW